MVPENIVALAVAISTHYTGKPDAYLDHISTAASFLKHATAAGWTMTRVENVKPIEVGVKNPVPAAVAAVKEIKS